MESVKDKYKQKLSEQTKHQQEEKEKKEEEIKTVKE